MKTGGVVDAALCKQQYEVEVRYVSDLLKLTTHACICILHGSVAHSTLLDHMTHCYESQHVIN